MSQTPRSVADASADPPELSVVLPCFNEEDVLEATYERLVASLEPCTSSFELVFVDDGSSDRTAELLRGLQARDSRCRFLRLSRNFGQPAAVTAGLDFAAGRAVVIIDADLQDPPELIAEMLVLWRSGYDVVYGRRTERAGESWFKLKSAELFYRLLARVAHVRIPVDVGDFRLMDRRVVDALATLGEQHRYMRGLVSWLGFRQVGIDYKRLPRTGGASKYPIGKMVRVASDALFSFSLAPLRAAIWLGLATAGLAMLGLVYAIVMRLLTSIWVSGWTLLFVAVTFLGGVQLVFLGVIGEYIGRIFIEVKRRPLYLVDEGAGFPPEKETRIRRRVG